MKRIIAVFLTLACITSLLAACSDTSPKQAFEPTEVENVSISISDVSPTGATVTIKDTNAEPYMYGEWYAIEKENGGTWIRVEPIIDNYGFTMIGYLPDENDEVVFDLNWEWLYGELPKGSYRLLKRVDDKYISVTFDLAE